MAAEMPSQNSLRRKFQSQRNSSTSTILIAANTTSPPSAAMGNEPRTGPATSSTTITEAAATHP